MELGAFSISLAVKDIYTFTDVRVLQRQLKAQGVQLITEPTRQRRVQRVSSQLTPTEIQFLSISTSELCADQLLAWPLSRGPSRLDDSSPRITRLHARNSDGFEVECAASDGEPRLTDA